MEAFDSKFSDIRENEVNSKRGSYADYWTSSVEIPGSIGSKIEGEALSSKCTYYFGQDLSAEEAEKVYNELLENFLQCPNKDWEINESQNDGTNEKEPLKNYKLTKKITGKNPLTQTIYSVQAIWRLADYGDQQGNEVLLYFERYY